jgi:hypothetical protein
MSAVKRFLDYEVGGIDHKDAPDYVDAFVETAKAELTDGSFRNATEDELETLNDNRELVMDLVFKKLY